MRLRVKQTIRAIEITGKGSRAAKSERLRTVFVYKRLSESGWSKLSRFWWKLFDGKFRGNKFRIRRQKNDRD